VKETKLIEGGQSPWSSGIEAA